ncbi:MAG TPA: acyl-CoA dehydrogenase family protein [Solirubrobacterales bacterium]|jgi:putative acyl-CoA dehydrogenase|nr:acyl-CoA dehydrogenase family protein [Solirubrobacterales bacterium]
MATAERRTSQTHEVFNQPPPLEDYNSFDADQPLIEALRREGAGWAEGEARELGAICGSHQTIQWGFEANERKPELKTHDRYGHRIDEVEFDSSWHELMRIGVGNGLHASPWREPGPGAHVARAAKFNLLMQAESGVGCPISMTYSAIPALRKQPELAAEWEPHFLSLDYDERSLPADRKSGALCGMAMTEKQGGSDVRANTTVATPLNGGGPGAEYELVGHKWFCSAPMCDAFLVLAQTDAGISCFLMPRWTPDGERNGFQIQRLKDKLGNRSNASSELEFRGAWARLIGEEGRGVPTIIEMVNHTRLDCVIGAATGQRAGVVQAIHHATHRSAFGKELVEQPLMRNVLADLCVESEAATISAMRLARAYDEVAAGDEEAREFRRLANAVLKYWLCKRAPWHAVECLECLGGNGYVEESGMPRLFRESPLASIWEGSGNVQCLDVLRAMVKSPSAVDAFFAEVLEAAGAEPKLDTHVAALREEIPGDVETIEARARRIVERMALALQASLLVRYGDQAVADAFCASRLSGDWGYAFGTLPAGTDFGRIVERHSPHR